MQWLRIRTFHGRLSIVKQLWIIAIVEGNTRDSHRLIRKFFNRCVLKSVSSTRRLHLTDLRIIPKRNGTTETRDCKIILQSEQFAADLDLRGNECYCYTYVFRSIFFFLRGIALICFIRLRTVAIFCFQQTRERRSRTLFSPGQILFKYTSYCIILLMESSDIYIWFKKNEIEIIWKINWEISFNFFELRNCDFLTIFFI